jgi:hypothetical protein
MSLRNDYKEIHNLLEYTDLKVKCAYIVYNGLHYAPEDNKIDLYVPHRNIYKLKVGYNEEEYNRFMSSINFDYKDFPRKRWSSGVIWFDDDKSLLCKIDEFRSKWDIHIYIDIRNELK